MKKFIVAFALSTQALAECPQTSIVPCDECTWKKEDQEKLDGFKDRCKLFGENRCLITVFKNTENPPTYAAVCQGINLPKKKD